MTDTLFGCIKPTPYAAVSQDSPPECLHIKCSAWTRWGPSGRSTVYIGDGLREQGEFGLWKSLSSCSRARPDSLESVSRVLTLWHRELGSFGRFSGKESSSGKGLVWGVWMLCAERFQGPKGRTKIMANVSEQSRVWRKMPLIEVNKSIQLWWSLEWKH